MGINKDKIKEMISNATSIELELFYLPKIMANQTFNEQEDKDAYYRNNKGLNKIDAPYITSLYNNIKCGFHLNEFQVIYLRRVLKKYWKQYIEGGKLW